MQPRHMWMRCFVPEEGNGEAWSNSSTIEPPEGWVEIERFSIPYWRRWLARERLSYADLLFWWIVTLIGLFIWTRI